MHLLNESEIYTQENMRKEIDVYLNSLHFELLISYLTIFSENKSIEFNRNKLIELILIQTKDSCDDFIQNIYEHLKVNCKEKYVIDIIDLLTDIINKIIFMKRRNKEQKDTEKETRLLLENWNYEEFFNISNTVINYTNIPTIEFDTKDLNLKKLDEEAQKEFEENYGIP